MRFVAGGRAQHGLPHLSDWAAAPERRPFRLRSWRRDQRAPLGLVAA
jgi:hypothetical protein